MSGYEPVGSRKIDGKWLIAHEHFSVPFYMDGSYKPQLISAVKCSGTSNSVEAVNNLKYKTLCFYIHK